MATKTNNKVMTYTVTGRGTFPVDMLRYDRVTPATEGDARAVESTFQRGAVGEPYVTVRGERCTVGRWESFGWRVLPQL